MAKKPARKKPINWRVRYDKLLALLFKIRNNPLSRYQDMRITIDEVEELHTILENTRRFEWRKVGMSEHLYPVGTQQPYSVASVFKDAPGKYTYTIFGKGHKQVTDYVSTLSKAKQAVEKSFEVLQTSED